MHNGRPTRRTLAFNQLASYRDKAFYKDKDRASRSNNNANHHVHHPKVYSRPSFEGLEQNSFDQEENVFSFSPSFCNSETAFTGERNSFRARSSIAGMRRAHKILSPEEIAAGKTTNWMELEITGPVRNLSEQLWTFKHLTALFLNGNQLQRIPPEISGLSKLQVLDLSHNKLRSLPVELGDMTSLQHLYLNYNLLRVLPYELGKLFRLQTLGIHGNPLNPEIARIYNEPNGTQRLLQWMLDHLAATASLSQDEVFWIRQTSAATQRRYQQQQDETIDAEVDHLAMECEAVEFVVIRINLQL